MIMMLRIVLYERLGIDNALGMVQTKIGEEPARNRNSAWWINMSKLSVIYCMIKVELKSLSIN
jgi:hypothetical protein